VIFRDDGFGCWAKLGDLAATQAVAGYRIWYVEKIGWARREGDVER